MSGPVHGDRETDRLYAGMRGRHGTQSALANGYRYEGYFRREQALVLGLLSPDGEVVVDVACGSGLMLEPLLGERPLVFGIDFNDAACRAARANGFPVVRGDAFRLPLADATVDELVSCQFFNQQPPRAVAAFVKEAARVLKPGGHAVLVWRNAAALVHRLAHAVLGVGDRLAGRAVFPQYRHDFAALRGWAAGAGLAVRTELVAFAPLRWRSADVGGLLAGLIGASNVIVLERRRPDPEH